MQEAYCFSLGDINSKKCTNRTQQQQKINNEINDVNTISTKENKLQYSDEKFLLLDKIGSKRFDHNDMKFNPFEIRCLLEQFLLEIKKQCRSKPEAYYKSPLFRMYVVFHFHKNTKLFRTFDFYDFLEYIIDDTTDFYNSYKKNMQDSFLFYNFDVHNFTVIKDEGYFIVEDIIVIKQIILTFIPFRFSKAVVYGVLMKSRGTSCSEVKFSENPLNPWNNLAKHWFDTTHLSSWFKYRYQVLKYRHDANFGFQHNNYIFGQFNYFFRVYLLGEPLLHGLPMASAVCRFSQVDKYMDTIDIKSASYVKEVQFVVLTNVFSTKVLIGARDSDKIPIKLKKNYGQIMTQSTVRVFSNSLPSEATDLYLLDLNPNRKSLVFDKLNENYNEFEYKRQKYNI